MVMRPFFDCLATRAVWASVLLINVAGVSRAGLSGQPVPTPSVAGKIQAVTTQIRAGQVASGRPDLMLLVEANAPTDLTNLLSQVVGDDATYNGITATFEDALAKAGGDATRNYLVYNLARVYLLRARLVSTSTARRGPLDAASKTVARFPATLRDPAAWELTGDIASERGDLEAALAAYKRMTTAGGSNAYTLYKSGLAYLAANRIAQAQTTFAGAAQAERSGGAGSPSLRHRIYQGLALAYTQSGNDAAALQALVQSSRVEPDADAPFRFETEAARRLLARGHAREVLTYALAALRIAPDDPNALALRDAAIAQNPRRTR